MLPLLAPADTTDYMVLGFAVILGAIGTYLLSIWVRFRRTRQDMTLLSELKIAQK